MAKTYWFIVSSKLCTWNGSLLSNGYMIPGSELWSVMCFCGWAQDVWVWNVPLLYHRWIVRQDAMLSQGEPRDTDISLDTTVSCMRFLWHSTGFLHRPATVQMLELHTVRSFSQPWRKITAIKPKIMAHDQNHEENPRWSWLFYSAKKCYNAYVH